MPLTYEATYRKVQQQVEHLLNTPEDADLKNAILKNVDEIRSWLPKYKKDLKPNNILHKTAQASLNSALAILNTIEQLNTLPYQLDCNIGQSSLAHHIFEGGHVLIEDDGELLNRLFYNLSVGELVEEQGDDSLFKHLKEQNRLDNRYSSHYKNEKMTAFKKANKHRFNPKTDKLEKAALKHFNTAKTDISLKAEVIFNELLIGKITIDGKVHTWLQFEGHSHQARQTYKNILVRFLDKILQLFSYSFEKLLHHADFLKYVRLGKRQNIGQYGTSFFTESTPILMKKMHVEIEEEKEQVTITEDQPQLIPYHSP